MAKVPLRNGGSRDPDTGAGGHRGFEATEPSSKRKRVNVGSWGVLRLAQRLCSATLEAVPQQVEN